MAPLARDPDPAGDSCDDGRPRTGAAATVRLTLLCAGANGATRATAFPAGDEPLGPRALRALPAVAARLGRSDRCASSPAASALASAAALGLRPAVDPRLRDCDYGRWTGQTLAAVAAADPAGVAAWMSDPDACPHGGETLAAVAARVSAWLATCLDGPGRTLAVTHPLFIRIAVTVAIEVPLAALWRLDVAPLGLTCLTAQAGRWRLASLNEGPRRGGP